MRLEGFASRPGSALFQPEHALRILMTDFLLVGLREMIERLDHLDGRADVAPALLFVERAVGCEQHVVDAEERDPADRRRPRAGERSVAVEALEIVERPL